MRYKHLIISLTITFILTAFFISSTFAQAVQPNADESNLKKRAHDAITRYGGPGAIKERCEQLYGPGSPGGYRPDMISSCESAFKRGFCGIILYGNSWMGFATMEDVNLNYEICYEMARLALAGPVSKALGLIGQIGTTVLPPTGPGAAGAAVKGVKAARDIIKNSEILKEDEKPKKTSMIESLNKNVLNQKIPSAPILSNIGMSIQNEKININILDEKQKYSAQIGIVIKDGTVVQITDGQIPDATINVYLSESKVNAILKSPTIDVALNVILASVNDGNIRVAGTPKTYVAQRSAVIYSKFISYPFDVSAGQTKSVNFGGTESTLERNALGQRIVSVGYSDVVFRASKGGELLGYSTKGIQKLIKTNPKDFSIAAGYYGSVPTHYFDPYKYVAWPR